MKIIEYNIVLSIAISLIVIGLVYKFLFWTKAKKNENKLPSFIVQIFIWYNIYTIYDSASYELKSFMKANNQSNKLIWLGLFLLFLTIFLNKYLKILLN